MAKLQYLNGPNDDSRSGDVVFVHGLGGHPIETWMVGTTTNKNEAQTWANWLSDDKPSICVWSLGYDAAPSKWVGSPMALSDRATNALAVLDGHNLGSKPICFITHSMGGLLVKQMLRHASNQLSAEYGIFSDSTHGIVFFSTPHAGAELANFVNGYLSFFRPSAAIKDLEAHHPRLRELTQWYRNEAPKLNFDTKVFYETQPTKGGIVVVNPTSADPGIPNVTPIPVDADHFTICKPANKDALVYLQISKFIDKVFNPAHRVVLDANAAAAIATLTAKLEARDIDVVQKDNQIAQLTAAVNALVLQADQPSAPLGINEALEKLVEGETEAAETIFQQIADRKKEDILVAAEAYRHIGSLAFFHDTNKALGALRRATELNPDNPDGWNLRGHLEFRVGELLEAEKAHKKVLLIGEINKDKNILAVAYGSLGNVYQIQGKLNEAIIVYKKALAIDQEYGHKEGMAIHYGNLGIVYQNRGDLDTAETMYNNALEINQSLDSKHGISRDCSNLGIVYLIRSDLDKAETMLNKALAIDQEYGHKEGIALNYGNLGIVYQNREDFDKAETMQNKALEINQLLENKLGIARNYGNLGNVYRIRGKLDQAEAVLNKALVIDQELGRKQGMANEYGNLGIVYQNRGDLDKAEAMYNKALTIDQELGHKEGMAINYGNLGSVYLTRGDLDQAVTMLEKALDYNKNLGSKGGMADNYLALGAVYQILGKLNQVETVWKKSLALSQDIGNIRRVELVQCLLDELR